MYQILKAPIYIHKYEIVGVLRKEIKCVGCLKYKGIEVFPTVKKRINPLKGKRNYQKSSNIKVNCAITLNAA